MQTAVCSKAAFPLIAIEKRTPLDVRFVPILLKKSDFTSDQNFTEALVRSSENYVGGPHHQSDFQRAAFASSLQGVGLPHIGFDECPARFCRQLIFEFFNNICQEETSTLKKCQPRAREGILAGRQRIRSSRALQQLRQMMMAPLDAPGFLDNNNKAALFS